MELFEPKIYTKDGVKAYRLVGSDGSEFFYEGSVDYDPKELHKDTQGRLYYPVVGKIGGGVTYYVELDPQVPEIPATSAGPESAAARLINASPRSGPPPTEGVTVKPEETPRAAPAEAPPVTPPETPAIEPATAPGPSESEAAPVGAAPAPSPEEAPVMDGEASDAIKAIFTPKAGAAAGKAGGPARPGKKRSPTWLYAVGAVVLVLALCAIGVYFLSPGMYDGVRSMLHGPPATPTPEPTVTPTPEPSPTATPSPTPTPVPASDIAALNASIVGQIDSDSPSVAAFAQAHVSPSSAGNPLRQACDLFNYVNAQWTSAENGSQTRKASEIAVSLNGTDRDYTVLMVALMRSIGFKAEVVVYYAAGIDAAPGYYPEILVSRTESEYQAVTSQLQAWYGITSPQGRSDEVLGVNWIALSRGDAPGVRPAYDTAYALNGTAISPIIRRPI